MRVCVRVTLQERYHANQAQPLVTKTHDDDDGELSKLLMAGDVVADLARTQSSLHPLGGRAHFL